MQPQELVAPHTSGITQPILGQPTDNLSLFNRGRKTGQNFSFCYHARIALQKNLGYLLSFWFLALLRSGLKGRIQSWDHLLSSRKNCKKGPSSMIRMWFHVRSQFTTIDKLWFNRSSSDRHKCVSSHLQWKYNSRVEVWVYQLASAHCVCTRTRNLSVVYVRQKSEALLIRLQSHLIMQWHSSLLSGHFLEWIDRMHRLEEIAVREREKKLRIR